MAMENRIIETQGTPKMQAIINKAKNNNHHVVEIDGFGIQDTESFLEAIEEGFRFPVPIDRHLFDRIEVIEDLGHLEWLDVDGFMIVVNNAKEMMRNNHKGRKKILDGVKIYVYCWSEERDRLLPERYRKFVTNASSEVVKLKALPFNVYLVD